MKKLFSETDRKNFKPAFYMVMMAYSDGPYEPATWEIEEKRFCVCDYNPDGDPEFSAELYDRETALRLLGEHMLTHSKSDTANKTKFHLMPVYTGFEDTTEVKGTSGNIVITGDHLLLSTT